MRAALEAIAEEMRRDPKIFYMSTDALPPLLKEFGPEADQATPITEAALTGMGIGAAGSGFRPIVDWRQVTFCFVAMEPDRQSGGEDPLHVRRPGHVPDPVPCVCRRRRPGRGAALAVRLIRCFMNVAGLKMFLPSTPYDMKGLLKTGDPRQQPCHLVLSRAG